jgi:hypothetical protein
MSTPVLHREPGPAYPPRFGRAAPAELQSARPGQLAEARAAALFASDLSARCEHTETEVAAAIRHAISTHNGLRGCAGEVAAAYGDRPETAARRMRWARSVVEGMYGTAPASSVNATDSGPGAPHHSAGHRPSLAEQGYVHGSFGGVPVLVGPELAAQLKAMRQKKS